MNRVTQLTTACLLVLGLAHAAAAADFIQGYNRGANDPLQLGSDFLFDEAATGGGDASDQTAPGFFNWVAEYTDLWDVGTDVSITGLAIPIQSNTAAAPNTTQSGDFTFTFFDVGGGANPDQFDGYSFLDMAGESILGTASATFTNAGGNATDEYYVNFDTPLNFTAASTGLAFHVQSTNTLRLKVNNPGSARRATRVNLDGTRLSGANSSFAATLAGAPVAFDPPPPATLEHRLDPSVDLPNNRQWSTVAPSIEQYAFDLPRAGDYNGDGSVNAADYTRYRDNVGDSASFWFSGGSRDETNTGPINSTDYDFWAANYGSEAPVAIPVNDPSVPGLTAAFDTGAVGQANVYEQTLVDGVRAARQDASFEIWIKPDDLAGGDQVLYEVGGTGTGSYISLQGDQLSFYVNGQFDGNEQTVSTTLTDTDWTQVVAVIHNTFEATLPSSDDFIELYVDGVLAASNSAATTDLNRWAGGNQAGIGLDGGVRAAGGPIDVTADTTTNGEYAFAGQIAQFEYAANAWDATEVLARYNAITGASATSVPEPTSVVLVLSAIGWIGATRRS